MPIRMTYKKQSTDTVIEVDVYHIDYVELPEGGIEVMATCWVIDSEYWLVVPISYLRPIKNKSILTE